jgi:hypothetical protein
LPFIQKLSNHLRQRYGEVPDAYLKGKKIIVYGEARRVKIYFWV